MNYWHKFEELCSNNVGLLLFMSVVYVTILVPTFLDKRKERRKEFRGKEYKWKHVIYNFSDAIFWPFIWFGVVIALICLGIWRGLLWISRIRFKWGGGPPSWL